MKLAEEPRGRGRPPKPASQRRTRNIYVKLTEEERKLLDSATDNPTVFARDATLRAAKRAIAKR